jgi:predicted GIY-YIG superfamily endonuclease
MKYLCLLQSISNPKKCCTGVTADFRERLKQHNAGESPTAAKHRPWKPVLLIRFEDDAKAQAFEHCLKFGSGHASANKHFWRHFPMRTRAEKLPSCTLSGLQR